MKKIVVSFVLIALIIGLAAIGAVKESLASSIKYIRDDATGGDCPSIGTWDFSTKTCTLTTDVYETIQIKNDGITLDGNGHTVTITGWGFGVYIHSRTGVTIKNLNVQNNIQYFGNGIYLYYSNNNTLTNNTVSNNYTGIALDWHSSNNTLINNTVSDNHIGIILSRFSNNNTITNNTVSSKGYGILLGHSSNNKIYNNNFIDNPTQAYVYMGSDNIFNLDKPVGGNYWSDYDTPAEGCDDMDEDGFCDASYTFFGGADYLPWTTQNGWGWDSDGDGIPDIDDLCPFEDATGFDADSDGCIDTLAGLSQVLETLPDEVLSTETKNSLVSKVDNAQKSADKEVINAAINQLEAFINEVEAQKGKKISEEVANMLIEYAQNIIAQLGGE